MVPLQSRRSPNTKRREEIRSGYLPLAVPKEGPKEGQLLRSPCLTPIFLRAQRRAELPLNPCIPGGPQTPSAGRKLEVAASALPSRGPKEDGIAK